MSHHLRLFSLFPSTACLTETIISLPGLLQQRVWQRGGWRARLPLRLLYRTVEILITGHTANSRGCLLQWAYTASAKGITECLFKCQRLTRLETKSLTVLSGSSKKPVVFIFTRLEIWLRNSYLKTICKGVHQNSLYTAIISSCDRALKKANRSKTAL